MNMKKARARACVRDNAKLFSIFFFGSSILHFHSFHLLAFRMTATVAFENNNFVDVRARARTAGCQRRAMNK